MKITTGGYYVFTGIAKMKVTENKKDWWGGEHINIKKRSYCWKKEVIIEK